MRILFLVLFLTSSLSAQNILTPACFGKIYEDNDSGSTITITAAGTYYPWITAEAGPGTGSKGCITTSTGDPSSLTIAEGGAGGYLVMWHAGIDIEGNAIAHGAIFKNGDRILPTTNHVESGAAGKLDFAISGATMVQLVAGDVLTLRFTSDTNADVVDVFHASLLAIRID